MYQSRRVLSQITARPSSSLFPCYFLLSPSLLAACHLMSNPDSFLFAVETFPVQRMPDTVPDTLYLKEEKGNNNCVRTLPLKMCILHLLLCAGFAREPCQESKLIKKILKVSAFSCQQHKYFNSSNFSVRRVIPALSPFGKSHLKQSNIKQPGYYLPHSTSAASGSN